MHCEKVLQRSLAAVGQGAFKVASGPERVDAFRNGGHRGAAPELVDERGAIRLVAFLSLSERRRLDGLMLLPRRFEMLCAST
jgi:hypothetical protein